jgi:acetyl esterase
MSADGGPPAEAVPIEQSRAAHERESSELGGAGEPVAEVRDGTVASAGGDVPVRVYRPADATGAWVAYFHGGGWAVGTIASFDAACRALANRSGATVVSAEYRLAPEHPFPAGMEDCVAVTRWVAEQAGGMHRVAVAGDSAGGNLAAVVSRRLRDEGAPPAFQLLIYPVVDAPGGTPSYEELGDGAYGLSEATMRFYWDTYVAGADGRHPDVAPLHAPDLAGLPPAYVLTAECDVLRDEGEAYARALQAAGVPVTVRRHDGCVHGFWRWQRACAVSRRAVEEAGAAVRDALPVTSPLA